MSTSSAATARIAHALTARQNIQLVWAVIGGGALTVRMWVESEPLLSNAARAIADSRAMLRRTALMRSFDLALIVECRARLASTRKALDAAAWDANERLSA